MTLPSPKPERESSPPVAKIRDGLVTASIWKHQSESGSRYSVSFERRYKDAEDNWKSSGSYAGSEILTLAKLADLAHTRILELRGDDSGE
jgi:hypothetical protein